MNDEKILSGLSAAGNSHGEEFWGRNAIAVFARAPVCGEVKSRLAQTIGDEKATQIYAAMLRDCLQLAERAADNGAEVLVAYTPADAFEISAHSLACFWNGARHRQSEGDLSARLLDCFSHLKSSGAGKIIIIGSDAPDIPLEYFRAAFDALDAHDFVFGPARDGGFYLIGAREVSSALFKGVAWSSGSTLATILGNASRGGRSTLLLDCWRDVDDLEDLRALAARLQANQNNAPQTRALLASENFLER